MECPQSTEEESRNSVRGRFKGTISKYGVSVWLRPLPQGSLSKGYHHFPIYWHIRIIFFKYGNIHPEQHHRHCRHYCFVLSLHVLCPVTQINFLFVCFFGCVGSSLLRAGFSPVAASGPRHAAFSLWWLLLLWSTGSRHAGLSSRGTQAQQLWLASSRAQAQQLWRIGLAALQHVGSSRTRAWTHVPCIGRQTPNHCATWEAHTVQFNIRLLDPLHWGDGAGTEKSETKFLAFKEFIVFQKSSPITLFSISTDTI